jgi:flagellar basal body rod protein FlgG
MLRGIYAAGSGHEANSINQDLITENLAHANVPGYRRRGAVFEPFEQILTQAAGPPGVPPLAQGPRGNRPQPPPVVSTDNLLWGTQPSFVYTDFRPGPLQYTGNPFDVAATGNTFFVVDGPNGPLLTRNGQFTIDNVGDLITRSGLIVAGGGGRIVIPTSASEVTIGPEGLVLADGAQVGQLLLATVADPTGLLRVGDTLFQGPVPSGPPIPGTVHVEQFYLEQANTDVITDMVTLISSLRHYEAAQRALRSLSDAIGQNTRPTA